MEGQWVLHWTCRRCAEETTTIISQPLTRKLDVPGQIECRKCQHPHMYGSMRSGNRLREDFAFICECGAAARIPYKSVVLGSEAQTGNYVLHLPEKVTCPYCKKETEVPAQE